LEVPPKIKIELPYQLVISLIGIYSKGMKSLYKRGTCIPMFISALFTEAKIWNQPPCQSTDEGIKKSWHACPAQCYKE
jgi:hypothetical protein